MVHIKLVLHDFFLFFAHYVRVGVQNDKVKRILSQLIIRQTSCA